MQITKTHKIIVGVIAVAILLSVYIFFDKRSRNAQNGTININTSEPLSTTTKTGINVEGIGSYTVEEISGAGSVPKPIPDLDRRVSVYSGAIIAPESREVALEKIPLLQTQLKSNPADVRTWTNLGIYQKMAGDYEGSVISWKYASKLSPNDYVSLANLGNLYGYFLKDNGQAEVYYKQAISKGPMHAYIYIQLAEVYKDIFKDIDKTRAIIEQGLSKIPNDPSLLQFQSAIK